MVVRALDQVALIGSLAACHASFSPMRQYSVRAMTLRAPPHIGQSSPSGSKPSMRQKRFRFLSFGMES
jgi:hypothetical protein